MLLGTYARGERRAEPTHPFTASSHSLRLGAALAVSVRKEAERHASQSTSREQALLSSKAQVRSLRCVAAHTHSRRTQSARRSSSTPGGGHDIVGARTLLDLVREYYRCFRKNSTLRTLQVYACDSNQRLHYEHARP